MSFKRDGDIPCKITETCLGESRFDNVNAVGGFDIALKVEDASDNSQSDWVRMEFSTNFSKAKNCTDKTQAQMTLDTLQRIGFKGGEDLSRLDELVGVAATVHTAKSDDGKYINAKYILTGGGNAQKKMDAAEIKRRMAAIIGKPGTAAQAHAKAQPAESAGGAIEDPFA